MAVSRLIENSDQGGIRFQANVNQVINQSRVISLRNSLSQLSELSGVFSFTHKSPIRHWMSQCRHRWVSAKTLKPVFNSPNIYHIIKVKSVTFVMESIRHLITELKNDYNIANSNQSILKTWINCLKIYENKEGG